MISPSRYSVTFDILCMPASLRHISFKDRITMNKYWISFCHFPSLFSPRHKNIILGISIKKNGNTYFIFVCWLIHHGMTMWSWSHSLKTGDDEGWRTPDCDDRLVWGTFIIKTPKYYFSSDWLFACHGNNEHYYDEIRWRDVVRSGDNATVD